MYGNLSDVPGILVGQVTDQEALTGCTVVLTPSGAVAGVDIRGAAPGTRETQLLRPMHLVQRVHAVVLAGGSAFGLDAACGVMHFLEEKGIGFDVGVATVPIVPAAILFDLQVGRSDRRPDREMGYRACQVAREGPVEEGNAGAGTGATVGKALGPAQAMKGGVGTSANRLGNGITVAALVVVNAFGDVVDDRGRILAGTLDPATGLPAGTAGLLRRGLPPGPLTRPGTSTTLAVVATDAALSKEQANKVAQMAHNGLARAISPVHTMYDGDAVFALSLGEKEMDVTVIGSVAAEVLADAVRRAVLMARGVAGIKASCDLRP